MHVCWDQVVYYSIYNSAILKDGFLLSMRGIFVKNSFGKKKMMITFAIPKNGKGA